jgi:hypothetical protein
MKLDMLQNGRGMIEYRLGVVLQERSVLHSRKIYARDLSTVVLRHPLDKSTHPISLGLGLALYRQEGLPKRVYAGNTAWFTPHQSECLNCETGWRRHYLFGMILSRECTLIGEEWHTNSSDVRALFQTL